MSADGSWPLQQAVHAALDAHAGLAALVGERIYDALPPVAELVYPYVALGDGTVDERDTKTGEGEEIAFTIHAWSRQRGRKEARQILSQVKAALHRQALTVAGFAFVEGRVEFAETFLDPDGLTYHGVLRYVALLDLA